MIGQMLGPYRILSKVGEGGMGVVWRARDTRLERDVALKVLPVEALGDQTARARLAREARLASQLNHPHICTIYDVGESEGQTYIGMELVEGQSLSDVLSSGPLPIEQVLEYGQQLAAALAHAHSRSVVHRDLKSANVVVTPEGQIKVLDFGLAKRLTDQDLAETTMSPQSLTAPGVVAGTLAYMAPEQLRGHPAEARSDVWALGVVLYEMAAGRRPFEGTTGFELTSAILSQPVPPVPASVPASMAAVVRRCLVKEPEARYQQGSEVKAALEAVAAGSAPARWPAWRAAAWSRRRWLGGAATAVVLLVVTATLVVWDVGGARSRLAGGAAAPARALRLAVLPFANLSGDPAQEYLGDGLTDEMITLLGSLYPESLSVYGRTSVMRYKKANTPVAQIARELGGADYVLEGSAQRDANRVRISARLVRVSDQAQVWTHPYEHDMSAIMMIQREMAKDVADTLALRLLPAQRDRLASARTVDPEAYEACLKGRALWRTLKPADLDTAQRYFDEALVKDPAYAAAYAGLALVWETRGYPLRVVPVSEAKPKAQAAARQAIALDGNSAEAHEALAVIRTWLEWDWAGAEREYRRALELNPSSPFAHAYYAHFLAIRGRADEALRHSERAIDLDPADALYYGLHAYVLEYLGRYDDALTAARKALSIQPDLGLAVGAFQNIYILKGMRSEQLADQRLRVARDPERLAAFEKGLKESGYEGAQRALADLLAARYRRQQDGPGPAVPLARDAAGMLNIPMGVALRYLDAGDKDKAIDWLYEAYAIFDPGLAYLGRPLWSPLRRDQRFQALLIHVGLPLPQ